MGTMISKCCDDCFCLGNNRKATVHGVLNDIKDLTRDEYDHLYETIVQDATLFGKTNCKCF